MGKIVITEFVSLDGVVEDPGGVGGFKHAGWTFEIDRGEDGEERRGLGQAPDRSQLLSRVAIAVAEYKLRETLGTEALLLGRITYEEFAALWPSRDGEFADKFNSLPKYVVSSTLEDPEWNNSTVLAGDVVEEVSSLKRELDGEIVVHGSIRLARTLIEHDLVDELRLMVYPVVLGSGERLFGELSDKKPLRLVDTRTVGDGLVIHTYEPVRDPGQGERHVPEMIEAEPSSYLPSGPERCDHRGSHDPTGGADVTSDGCAARSGATSASMRSFRRLVDEERRRPERPVPVVEHERDEEPSDPERARVETGARA